MMKKKNWLADLYTPRKELPNIPDAEDFFSKGKDGLWHFDFWWRNNK